MRESSVWSSTHVLWVESSNCTIVAIILQNGKNIICTDDNTTIFSWGDSWKNDEMPIIDYLLVIIVELLHFTALIVVNAR